MHPTIKLSSPERLRQASFDDIFIAMISPDQCRGARAMARLSTSELARLARVGVATINRFELGQASSNPATLAAIQRALEAAGVEFLPDNGLRLHATAGTAAASPGRSQQESGKISHTDQDAENGDLKPAPDQANKNVVSKPRRPRAKPLLMSKEAQIRALRERGEH